MKTRFALVNEFSRLKPSILCSRQSIVTHTSSEQSWPRFAKTQHREKNMSHIVRCHFCSHTHLFSDHILLNVLIHLSIFIILLKMHNDRPRVMVGIQTMIFQSGALCGKVFGTQLDNQHQEMRERCRILH